MVIRTMAFIALKKVMLPHPMYKIFIFTCWNAIFFFNLPKVDLMTNGEFSLKTVFSLPY